ncbi:MAG: histidine phosphatase family protein [Elusimicrobia bacterium]|nr:histidine phosphatase family protein [Elusimicrobiota bacterium]
MMTDKITNIVLMRHGKALSTHESKVSYDSERILSPVGQENAFTSAQKLRSLNFYPNSVISSPFVRAIQTAEIISSVFNKAEIQILPELAAPNSIETLLEILLKKEKAGNSLIAIGHVPTLNLLAELIIPKREFNFAPAGFAYMRINAKDFIENSKNHGKLVEIYNF